MLADRPIHTTLSVADLERARPEDRQQRGYDRTE
jgi:hypothetical protein